MNNDFKENCVETVCGALTTQRSTKGIRIFTNVFFVVMALGVVAACAIFEIPYNILNEIINEYKNNS